MEVVGDVLISAAINLLVEKLTASDILMLPRRRKIRAQFKKLQKSLFAIRTVLEDAEEKQFMSRAVKDWLAQLRDLAYDADDLLDEYATEMRRDQLARPPDNEARSGNLRSVMMGCFSGTAWSPKELSFNARMLRKLKEINARFQELVGQKSDLDLMESFAGERREGSGDIRDRLRASSSIIDKFCVYGRETDKAAILDQLLMEDGSDEIPVIPIVGMGGVGKTTLAQLVYNAEEIQEFFNLKIWVCVSVDFDVVGLTKSVLQDTRPGNDLDLLQLRLKEKLLGKKYLLVLDDVWNQNYELWTLFRRPLDAGSHGSKIIVTTRNQGVASMMGTLPAYNLSVLSYDNCLSLFAHHALGSSNFDERPELREVGKEIVKRCGGLPLAAKTLGGLLRTKSSCKEWEKVLSSRIWELPEERSGIVPALRLSYHHLPSHLKQCFAYCAMFPKDYEFCEDEIVQLWVAEGFIRQSKGRQQIENLGRDYFYDLLSRSFFQPSSDKVSRFVMHDLINDLAQSVAGEMCLTLNDKLGDNELNISLERVRHISFTRHSYEVWQRFKGLCELKGLRTFVALPTYTTFWAADCFLSNNVLHDLLPKLECLRVLCLSGYCVTELPRLIGGLKHLRYLNLSQTKIAKLPESVGSLINLEALILRGCTELMELPQGLENLINLSCLDISDTPRLKEMPLQVRNLKSLQILPKFIVSRENGLGIRGLGDLMHLRGTLSILGLHNVVDAQDANCANLRGKHSLDYLELEWSRDSLDSRNEEVEMLVLDWLQPSKNLKKLTISSYGGKKFPSWLGDLSFSNMVHLRLCNCGKVKSLPSLGKLASLKELSIEGMDEVERVDTEFFGYDFPFVKSFPSLEMLSFHNMFKWEYWSSASPDEVAGQQFPHLRELMISNCPKLIQSLPTDLPLLMKLTVTHCPKLTGPLKRLPSLNELNIEECNEEMLKSMSDLTSLTSLRIRSMSVLNCLLEKPKCFLGALKVLVVSNCAELISLWDKGPGLENSCLENLLIKDSPRFVSLAENEQSFAWSHEDLEPLGCSSRPSPYWSLSLMALKDLRIESCPKIVSIPEIGVLPALKCLMLKNCQALKFLSNFKSNRCLLEDLEIEECTSFISFPRGILFTALRRLKIRYCTNLQSLPEGTMHDHCSNNNISQLEILEIIDCPSLTSFPTGKFPTGLKVLKVWDCLQLDLVSKIMLPKNTSLEYLSISNCTLTRLPECLGSLMHLTVLIVDNCLLLRFFPEIGLPIPKLKTLNINNCPSLDSLPNQMHKLRSLQDLNICDCRLLKSFPRGGLPPNLTTLEIWDCEQFEEPMSKWNLHYLNSLKDLSIAGGCFLDGASFPDQNCLLPSTLTSIYIGRLQNLEHLSVGICNLTSLQEIEIFGCPKLRSLPKEGLPPTLGRLSIKESDLLKQRCLKDRGKYWPRIAHIPCIEIDDVNIN